MVDLRSLAAVCVLAAVPIFVSRLRATTGSIRNVLLSFASGVSLAYVFTYILPKLAAKHQVLFRADDPGLLGYLEHHAYLVALGGFLIFYGLDLIAKRSKARAELNESSNFNIHAVFELQVAVFSAYNVLVGYLLVQVERPLNLWLMVIALGMHFLAADAALRRQNPIRYDSIIRWIFFGCTLCGWTIAQYYNASDAVEALWFAFLAGSIIIIVIQEEIPSEQHARFWPFLIGCVMYTGLILTIERL